jgi:hypothetical protein
MTLRARQIECHYPVEEDNEFSLAHPRLKFLQFRIMLRAITETADDIRQKRIKDRLEEAPQFAIMITGGHGRNPGRITKNIAHLIQP